MDSIFVLKITHKHTQKHKAPGKKEIRMVKIIKKGDLMQIINGDKVLHLVLNTQGKQLFVSGERKFWQVGIFF